MAEHVLLPGKCSGGYHYFGVGRLIEHDDPCECGQMGVGTFMPGPAAAPPEVTPGGAKRNPKPGPPANWFSIDRETELAIAETAAEGDARYGMDNWRRGIPVSNLFNHAMDHLAMAREGDSTEPHIQHAIWNLGKILWMAKHKPDMVDVPMIRKALCMPPMEAE